MIPRCLMYSLANSNCHHQNEYLNIGSGTHAVQTANVMIAIEAVIDRHLPDLIVVVGDVNSTLACALVAAKLGVPVAHVEAGLRSYDRDMPEEINRILTDQLADLLFTTERSANLNLIREGISEDRIHFVGNVMIDTLLHCKEKALALDTLKHYGLKPGEYILTTLHRPSNVDNEFVFAGILNALSQIQSKSPIIFPAHPRVLKQIRAFKFEPVLAKMPNLRLIDPLGYMDFLNLMANSRFVLTDSGGIQEETTILRVPCLTLRNNTERPVTTTQGTNVIVGTHPERIVAEATTLLSGTKENGQTPELWDGYAAKRLVKIL